MTTTAPVFEAGIYRREVSRAAPAKHGRWRASDAGKCEIQQMLKAAGVEQDPLDYETLLKFQICSAMEDFVVDTYVQSYEDDDHITVYGDDLNVFADNELNISGHADIVIRGRDGDILNLIEVKSLNLFFMKHLKKEPMDQWYFYGQIQVYMHMAGLDRGEFLIVERNTPEVLHYPVEFDTDHWLWLRAMYERLNAYWSVGMLPSIAEVEGEMKCDYCPFASRCKGGEEFEAVQRLLKEALGAGEEVVPEEAVGEGT